MFRIKDWKNGNFRRTILDELFCSVEKGTFNEWMFIFLYIHSMIRILYIENVIGTFANAPKRLNYIESNLKRNVKSFILKTVSLFY